MWGGRSFRAARGKRARGLVKFYYEGGVGKLRRNIKGQHCEHVVEIHKETRKDINVITSNIEGFDSSD